LDREHLDTDEETRRAVHTAFELSPVPQALVAPDATLIYVNRAAAALVGRSAEELRGVSFAAITDERSLPSGRAALAELTSGALETMHIDIWLKRSDGTSVEVDITAAAVHDDDGELRYITAAAYDVTDRRRTERAVHHRAAHDALTELPNRAWFTERLGQALAHSARHGTMVGVYFVDLDGFKQVNDERGHDVGDQVLFALAGRLDRSVRPGDTLARYGGDEFTILCEDIPGVAEASEIAERVLRAVERPVQVSGGEVCLSASIGVALGDPGEGTAASLIRNADMAMYEAKRLGKGQYRVVRD
jgi:diguanylate cyclase (GGDEF)-like protein/PAS domain S-box-containing protein